MHQDLRHLVLDPTACLQALSHQCRGELHGGSPCRHPIHSHAAAGHIPTSDEDQAA
eukprot:CAMPEP_0180755246 /NCGR_PEP_ID=MMETSP1038_2-20121128/33610_1 /TAXON_ID=632150 /ORGANISM="Azadinium spinosum, Strain 3D9" /LENGTH=55 /DNA_ID=CAMNT_0022789179 /DNA_START=180 /DNA_END=344 /DNA_ORIENTATION=+